MKIKYLVGIRGIGMKEVEASATDLDDAYEKAMKIYRCKLGDIEIVSPTMTVGETIRLHEKEK